MNQGYQDEKTAQDYLEFLASKNGQLQQKFLYQALRPLLPDKPETAILDAACGPGWLLALLALKYKNLWGFDASPVLLSRAKKIAPEATLKLTDISKQTPFPEKKFDCIILNMAAPDLEDLDTVFFKLSSILQNSGRLIVTLPNPNLTYPVAVWKKGVLAKLLGQKPELKFTGKKIASGQKITREFGKNKIASYYYSFEDYHQAAVKAGLKEKNLTEIRSATDSPDFDLTYQLFRYPLLLALVFEKPT